MFLAKKLPLSNYEKKLSPINGIVEEGLIEHIISRLGHDNMHKFCVEFGAGDGTNHSFTKNLIEKHKWNAFLIEASPKLSADLLKKYQGTHIIAKESFITQENILDLFSTGKVPKELGFLCVDIDGNDYYILKKILENYSPQVICVEFNASYGPQIEFKIDYDPDFIWNGDDYFGASFSAFLKLCDHFNYTLIHCTSGGDNLFFVQNKYANQFTKWKSSPEEFYQLPQYGRYGRAPNGKGHPASKKNTTKAERLKYKSVYWLMNPVRKISKLFAR